MMLKKMACLKKSSIKKTLVCKKKNQNIKCWKCDVINYGITYPEHFSDSMTV